jgi:adenylate kinase
MGTIFIGGVHGVGKTVICRRVASQLELFHNTASAMIAALNSSVIKPHTKSVDNISRNQDILVQAINQYFSSGKDRLILDGHFVIPNMVPQFKTIDVDIFKHLRLDGVVVCHDDPYCIYARRMIRDKKSLAVRMIAEIQKIELEHAQFVAESLGIPFLI